MAKVDVVYVERKDGASVESFSINDIDSAKNLAANLYNYHGEPFNVVVVNEESHTRVSKNIKLEKEAKYFLNLIKIQHKNSITGQLGEYRS